MPTFKHPIAVGLVATALLMSCAEETPTAPASEMLAVRSYPASLDPSCGDGRARIYDECGSQVAILESALAEARTTGKTVVVNFGAEWCIWCHVFDRHLKGATGRFSYPVEGEDVTLVERSGRDVLADAQALNAYASSNLIIVHIEAENSPDGWQALAATGADAHFDQAYPFVFSLTPAGQFATALNDAPAERRRDTVGDWYRGYDRAQLLAELQRLREEATRPAPPAPNTP
jgi:thiol-disulfide isomerase/thioredoxin